MTGESTVDDAPVMTCGCPRDGRPETAWLCGTVHCGDHLDRAHPCGYPEHAKYGAAKPARRRARATGG
jgi:hypothetical protein